MFSDFKGSFKKKLGIPVKDLAAILGILVLIYAVVLYVNQGWVTYFATVVPAIIVLITAWVRLDDIDRYLTGIFWHMRRMGLIFLGAIAAMVLAGPFTTTPYFPTKFMMLGMWGLAFCWVTAPGIIPWWRIILHYQPLSEQVSEATIPPPPPESPSPG